MDRLSFCSRIMSATVWSRPDPSTSLIRDARGTDRRRCNAAPAPESRAEEIVVRSRDVALLRIQRVRQRVDRQEAVPLRSACRRAPGTSSDQLGRSGVMATAW